MKKIFPLLFLFLVAVSCITGCSNDITANYETVKSDKIELTSNGESIVTMKAFKDGNGKIVFQIADMKGNMIQEFKANEFNF